MTATGVIFEARQISRSFAAVRALTAVDLAVRAGEIHALCGENGAGKSTLMAIFAGALEPDQGSMEIDGRRYAPASPLEARRAGIAIVYQERSLMGNISVAENICMTLPLAGGRFLLSKREMAANARRLLRDLDHTLSPNALVADYGIARQQVVEIAKALAREPRMLILDEPTASIDADARAHLFAILRRLRSRGLGIVYISHHLDEVYEIADRVSVLRNGRLVGTWPVAEIDSQRLAREMVGRALATTPAAHGGPGAASGAKTGAALAVEALAREGDFANIDLAVRSGEIVGLGGLVGAGRTKLGESIFGLRMPDRGTVRLAGRVLPRGRPDLSVRRGLALVTEDRKETGLFMEKSVRDNIAAPSLGLIGKGPLVDDRFADALAAEYCQRLGIRTPSIQTRIGDLSGGNQQKVLIAMWLATRPAVLIVDEPTKGIDVGAKAEIHRLLVALRDQGLAILLISSDHREVVSLSDRILVMRKGRLVASLPAGASADELVAYASGAVHAAAA